MPEPNLRRLSIISKKRLRDEAFPRKYGTSLIDKVVSPNSSTTKPAPKNTSLFSSNIEKSSYYNSTSSGTKRLCTSMLPLSILL